MKIAIHQPNYMPWAGYFYKLLKVDLFIFLDDVQFSKNSFINRTKITQNGQPVWLSIPVRFNLGDSIKNVKLAQKGWEKRHLSKIKNIYQSTPYFNENWNDLEELLQSLHNNDLAEINKKIITKISKWLDINVLFKNSSQIPNLMNLKSDDRLIDIIKKCNSNIYFSGIGAKRYQDEKKFKEHNIKLIYSNFTLQEQRYISVNNKLKTGTSILDALFFLGRKKTNSFLLNKF